MAALFTQEISVIKECNFCHLNGENNQFARTDNVLAGYITESIMAWEFLALPM
jgi:hypothetical protein